MNPPVLISEYIKEDDKFLNVVRVKTTWWQDNSGLCQKKSITYQRRKSKNIWFEDYVSESGSEDAFYGITNLDECGDGLYSSHTYNHSRDWESVIVDSSNLCKFLYFQRNGTNHDIYAYARIKPAKRV